MNFRDILENFCYNYWKRRIEIIFYYENSNIKKCNFKQAQTFRKGVYL